MEKGVREWTFDYQFTADDFKLTKQTGGSAFVHNGKNVAFSIDINDDLLENPCHGIRAIFDPELSWLDPSTDFEKAFKIAKMEFDFMEVFAREVRKSVLEDTEMSDLPEEEYQIDYFRLLILEPLQAERQSRWDDIFAEKGYFDTAEKMIEVQHMIRAELDQLNEFQYAARPNL